MKENGVESSNVSTMATPLRGDSVGHARTLTLFSLRLVRNNDRGCE